MRTCFYLIALATLMLSACRSTAPLPQTRPETSTCAHVTAFAEGQWPPACWRPYADSSPFNTLLPPNPVIHPHSAAIVARVLGDISTLDRPDPLLAKPDGSSGEPTYYARFGDPLFTLDCLLHGGTCTIGGMTIPIPAGAEVEGTSAAPATSDRHLTVIDVATGWEYDFWQVQTATPLTDRNGKLRFAWGGRTLLNGWGTTSEPVGTSGHGTASHFGNLAGRIRVEELEAGQINHALNIVINCGGSRPNPNYRLDDPTSRQRMPDWVFPAKAGDNPCSELGLSDRDVPVMGMRFHLNMTEEELTVLPIQEWKKTILRAMVNYGMFFGDTRTEGFFSIETEAGIQYTSLGHIDKWWEFGKRHWEEYTPPGGTLEYMGKLYNSTADPDPNYDWNKHIWSNLEIVDPCVSDRSC